MGFIKEHSARVATKNRLKPEAFMEAIFADPLLDEAY